jgi:hypothetical protein
MTKQRKRCKTCRSAIMGRGEMYCSRECFGVSQMKDVEPAQSFAPPPHRASSQSLPYTGPRLTTAEHVARAFGFQSVADMDQKHHELKARRAKNLRGVAK